LPTKIDCVNIEVITDEGTNSSLLFLGNQKRKKENYAFGLMIICPMLERRGQIPILIQ
jgi:hypothetical protein